MPRIEEFIGGNDISGERLRTRRNTLFFVLIFAETDQKFCSRAKTMPVLAGRIVKVYIEIHDIKKLFQRKVRKKVFKIKIEIGRFNVFILEVDNSSVQKRC